MQTMTTGTRVEIGAGPKTCVVEAAAPGPRLVLALAIRREGRAPEIRRTQGQDHWRIDLPDEADARTDIILYMESDSEPGRVEDRGPIRCRIGDVDFELPRREDRHGALIIGEIYRRHGKEMLRARGDGYAFGIKALARKEGLPLEPFLPERDLYDAPHQGQPQGRPSPRPRGQAIGSGSGVIISRDHLITNAHVVGNTSSQIVHGPEGDVDGRVIAIDEMHDLALVRARGMGGTALPLRTAGSLYLGEAIIAAGFPLRDVLGDDLKMTHGNVSGMKGQAGIVSAFQFSAPIGSGSSGGAVMDTAGNLVGIVTSALAHDAMRQRGAISENTNFACKASLVAEMLAAHEVDWNRELAPSGAAAEVARRIRRSVVAITVS